MIRFYRRPHLGMRVRIQVSANSGSTRNAHASLALSRKADDFSAPSSMHSFQQIAADLELVSFEREVGRWGTYYRASYRSAV